MEPYDLSGGGASFHGQGLVCAPARPGQVSITQIEWDVTGNQPMIPAGDPTIPDATMNPPSQPIELTTQQFVLGGQPVHVLATMPMLSVTATYAVGEALERIDC